MVKRKGGMNGGYNNEKLFDVYTLNSNFLPIVNLHLISF